MVLCMKTTVEINDQLLDEVKQLAAREGMTLRMLIEAGLRHVLAEREEQSDFKLVEVTFGGRGLRPEFKDGTWDKVRDVLYQSNDS